MPEKAAEPDFIHERLDALRCSPDRELIISGALEGKVQGVPKKGFTGPGLTVMAAEYDGTGVPGLARGLEGAAGRGPDGRAKTFEVKPGARFTARFTPDGLPLPGKDGAPARSRRIAYTGTAEKAGGFRTLLRGFTDGPRAEADAVEIIGDGAEWIAKTTEELFGEGKRM